MTKRSSLHILLLGANGRTGRQLLERALAAGDSVTALVRGPDRLADVAHARLDVRVGDPCDSSVLAALLPGHDLVVSVLGPRWPSRRAAAVYPRSAAALVEAMEGSGVDRLLVTSSALLFRGGGVRDAMLRFLVPAIVDGAQRMEDRIRASSLDWTIARTGFLNDADDLAYRLGEDALPEGPGAVSRVAVASFLHDEARRPRYRNRIVGLCG